MGKNVFISGSGNLVEGVENFAAINCHNQTYTSDNSNQSVLNNGAMIVKEDEVSLSVPIVSATANYQTKNTPFTVDKSVKIYFVDASGGSIDVTIVDDGVEHVIIKTDNSVNAVTLVPDSGQINGDVSYDITTQYGRAQPLTDGTDWYV